MVFGQVHMNYPYLLILVLRYVSLYNKLHKTNVSNRSPQYLENNL